MLNNEYQLSIYSINIKKFKNGNRKCKILTFNDKHISFLDELVKI